MSDREEVVIFGAGDFARIACTLLRKDSPYEVAAFTVHEALIRDSRLLGLDVLPFESLPSTHPPDRYRMFVAVGFRRLNRARTEIYLRCKELGYQLITYVSSRAIHWGEFTIGDNCFVFEANVIQPFVEIGSNVVIWSGNHIGHDSRIGDNCFIASHAVISGNVTIGAGCFVGVNSTFRDGITVGADCVIGAGARMLRDAEAEGVYAAPPTPRDARRSWDLSSI